MISACVGGCSFLQKAKTATEGSSVTVSHKEDGTLVITVSKSTDVSESLDKLPPQPDTTDGSKDVGDDNGSSDSE